MNHRDTETQRKAKASVSVCPRGEKSGATRPTTIRTLVRFAALGLLLAVVGGCATPVGFIPSFRREPPPSVEDLVAPLRQRAKPAKTLWLESRVRARRPGRLGQGIFTSTILIERPDHLRLRGYRSATFMIFDLLADGEGMRLRDATQSDPARQYYAATYERLRLANSSLAGLTPSLLISALMIEHTIVERVTSAQMVSVRRRWKTVEMRLETNDERIWVTFDRAGENILAVRYESAAGGRPTYLRYGEMVEADGLRLPQQLEIEHGQSRMRLRLEVRQYKVNPTFRPEVFMMEPPAGQSWLPLDM